MITVSRGLHTQGFRSRGTPLLLVAALLVIGTGSTRSADCVGEMLVGGEDAYDDFGCSVDVAPDGRAWVVWTGHDPVDEDEEVYYSVFEGGTWSPQERLHADNGSHDRFPSISITGDGVPWVLWNRWSIDGYRLWASHWTHSGWSVPHVVRSDASRYDDYDILAVATDDVWVATDTYVNDAPDRVVLVYHWDGASWSEPWLVSSIAYRAQSPDLGLAPDGRPWVVWMNHPLGGGNAEVARSAWVDTAWTQPEVVNADSGNSNNPQIVFDGGVPMVVWSGNHYSTSDIEYARLEGDVWSPAQSISLPDSSLSFDWSPSCEASPDGTIWVVWWAGTQFDAFSPAVMASRWSGGFWTTEQQISGDAPNEKAEHPDGAVGPDGEVWAVWKCYEETAPPWDTDIRATYCTEATPVDLGLLPVDVADGLVTISWYASGEAARGPFHVWRAQDGCDVPGVVSEPPGSAVRLNENAITGPPHEWTDAAPGGEMLCYWVEWARADGSVFLGPVPVGTPAASNDGPAGILFVAPNPMRAAACVGYLQREPGRIELEVYSVGGRRVARVVGSWRPPGRYERDGQLLCWNATSSSGLSAASGVYVVRLLFNGKEVPGQKTRLVLTR